MNLECSSYQTKNSYRDQVVLQVLLHGMRDNLIRSKVMSKNTTGDLAGLHETVDFILAEDAGCQEASDIQESSQVSGIRPRSTFKQSKSDEFRQKPCGYCGSPKHGNKNNSAERQKDCKAFGKICSKCKRENHLSNVCRSGPRLSLAEKPADSTLGFISGNFFSITAGVPPAPSQPDCSVGGHTILETTWLMVLPTTTHSPASPTDSNVSQQVQCTGG